MIFIKILLKKYFSSVTRLIQNFKFKFRFRLPGAGNLTKDEGAGEAIRLGKSAKKKLKKKKLRHKVPMDIVNELSLSLGEGLKKIS